MMNYMMNGMHMSAMLAEDAGAPELRNPRYGMMRRAGAIGRLLTAARELFQTAA